MISNLENIVEKDHMIVSLFKILKESTILGKKIAYLQSDNLTNLFLCNFIKNNVKVALKNNYGHELSFPFSEGK